VELSPAPVAETCKTAVVLNWPSAVSHRRYKKQSTSIFIVKTSKNLHLKKIMLEKEDGLGSCPKKNGRSAV